MVQVSIIIPCLNEERTIPKLLQAILLQDFPLGEMEVIVADGLSIDRTRKQILDFQKEHREPAIRIIDNPSRSIPAGLNLALNSASGDYIIRLDAHCVPRPDYVSKCITALQANRGWNVGGVWEIRPSADNWMAESIAIAASLPLGVGDAFYRFTDRAREVDTVPFGAFRHELITKIGGFDEKLQSNEDYEFNTRIRLAGGKVWLDPTIRAIYFARPSLSQLVRQYARYGYWKARMLRGYPRTIRLRQALPPLFVFSLIALSLISLALPWALWVLLFEVVSYLVILFSAGLRKALEHRKVQFILGIPLAIAAMHLSWGTAFLLSFLSPGN